MQRHGLDWRDDLLDCASRIDLRQLASELLLDLRLSTVKHLRENNDDLFSDAVLLEVGVVAALVQLLDAFVLLKCLTNGLVKEVGLDGQLKLCLVESGGRDLSDVKLGMVLGCDLVPAAGPRASLEAVYHRHEHFLVIGLFPRLILLLEYSHARIRKLSVLFYLLSARQD